MIKEIYEQASDWFVEFRAGDVDAARRTEFDAWVRVSPEHLRAYLEFAEIWQDSALANGEPPAAQLIELATTDDSRNVFDLMASARDGRSRSHASDIAARSEGPLRTGLTAFSTHRVRVFSRPLIMAAAAVLLVSCVGVLVYRSYFSGLYETTIAERRSIMLRDGSTVVLDAESRVRERFTAGVRDIDLLEGQAIFKVSHDTSRPFIVHSGALSVRAVGTQFDVNRGASSTTVTVIEGKVLVEQRARRDMEAAERTPDGGSGSGPLAADTRRSGNTLTFVAAGEQLLVSTAHAAVPKLADVAATTSWSTGTFVFKATPLDAVLEQFNRYNTRPLVIRGAGFEDFRISGLYSSTDPSLLLSFLRQDPTIEVQERADQVVISRKP